jgi:large subunit ribosomal protein L32
MPNPKRRHSKTRTSKRRTHDALRRQHRPVPSARARHRTGLNCGYYRDRQVRADDLSSSPAGCFASL